MAPNRWNRTTALPILLLFAGCLQAPALNLDAPAPAPSLPDLDALGPHKVLRLEYDFGPVPLVFRDSRGAPYPSRVVGSVHVPDGPGPFPLVLFMHGRHGTCKYADQMEFFEPLVCPDTPVTKNVRSYTGYDYLAKPLASHGYIVGSIDANNLNDLDLTMGDQGAVGRAQLISKTLDEFAKLHRAAGPAPIGDKLVGKIDLQRIGLMGHSRGGEGVTRFISWNEERTDGPKYALSAVFALAPTDFARWKVTNVVHAALLPYCDGDVTNLQGAWMYDDARYLAESRPSPKIQILAMGSNHNNYNTIWTGDDGGRYDQDPHCGPTNPAKSEPGRRLSPDDQRRHGRVYMESFFRYYVGGETGFAPLFTGSRPAPAEACPAGRAACADVLHVSYHAPAGKRIVLEDTMDEQTLRRNDAGGANTFTGFSSTGVCTAPSCPPTPNHGRANMLRLAWDGPATWLVDADVDASGMDALSFRAIVDYNDERNKGRAGQDLDVTIVDKAGASATVRAGDHSSALFAPPGNAQARRAVPNEVRLDLDLFTGIDHATIDRVEFHFGATPRGAVLLTDVLLQDEPDA